MNIDKGKMSYQQQVRRCSCPWQHEKKGLMDLRREQPPKAQANKKLEVKYKTIFHLRLILVVSVNISVAFSTFKLDLYINLLVSTVVIT